VALRGDSKLHSSVGAVRSILALILLGSFAYIGTMIDNLFAFAAQLTLTPRGHFSLVTVAQSAGVVVLVGLAAAVGSSLDVLPVRWVGLLAVAPWALAWRNWRHRRDEVGASVRRGAITTFLITPGLGGDNLAVWIPLLRSSGLVREFALCAIFASWQVLFIIASWALATHPRVVNWGQRGGRYFVPWLYVALGFVILYECRVL
jgi:cadmium resistance protein CadD (predicted permease)